MEFFFKVVISIASSHNFATTLLPTLLKVKSIFNIFVMRILNNFYGFNVVNLIEKEQSCGRENIKHDKYNQNEHTRIFRRIFFF